MRHSVTVCPEKRRQWVTKGEGASRVDSIMYEDFEIRAVPLKLGEPIRGSFDIDIVWHDKDGATNRTTASPGGNPEGSTPSSGITTERHPQHPLHVVAPAFS